MVSLVAGVPSHPRWVLGFKPQSSARTASAISHRGFSPASYMQFLKFTKPSVKEIISVIPLTDKESRVQQG